MFKLHRHRGDKSGERVDFRFGSFHATQVPKGWDKLSVSIISVESGKTIAKSGKASARNGSCQWPDSLSESVWTTPDDASKEPSKYPYKFVLTLGTTRSSILGESIINLADYMGSKVPVPISFALDKCSHGTTLQVKVQCLTPRSRFKNQQKETSSNPENLSADSDDMDNKSEGSAGSYARSVGSSSSNHLEDSHMGELVSRDIGHSASGSYRSSDSGEIPMGRNSSPSTNNIEGDDSSLIRTQNSFGHKSGSVNIDDPSLSNHSSFNSRPGLPNQRQVVSGFSPLHSLAPLSLKSNNSSSKGLLEAAEDTIDELRAEAKMWERNARKLKTDLENLRKDFSEKSRRQTDLDMELSAAFAERDSLKMEVDQLKKLLDETVTKQKLSANPNIFSEDANNLCKQLEYELKFQKEANSDLSNQLQKTQESNLELVSILQEMEETMEKQKVELSSLMQKEESSKSEKALDAIVESLEKQLEEKNQEIESEKALRHQTVANIEAQLARRLSEKNKEIDKLHGKLPDSHTRNSLELISEIESLTAKVQELEKDCNELTEENLDLIYRLKQSEKDPMPVGRSFNYQPVSDDVQTKLNELEQQLKEKLLVEDELTLFKNKCADLENQIQSTKERPFDLDKEIISCQPGDTGDEDRVLRQKSEKLIACGHVEIFKMLYKLEKQIQLALEDCGTTITRDCLEFFTEDTHSLSSEELNILFNEFYNMIAKLSYMLVQKKTEIEKFGNQSRLREGESSSLRDSVIQLEASSSTLQQEKVKLEVELEILSNKYTLTSKCFDESRNEITVLKESVDTTLSDFKLLEKKSVELEASKEELESHVAELEEENLQLSERISGMEAQLRYLTNEKESSRLELEDSHHAVADLRNQTENLQTKLEAQKLEMKQKLQDSFKRISEAEEELELSKRANSKLQVTIENLMEEGTSVQRINQELRRQREELQEKCTHLESNIRELQNSLSMLNIKIDNLDSKISSVDEEVNLKEKSFSSELCELFQKHNDYEEKALEVQNFLYERCLLKSDEIQKLQREVQSPISTNFNEENNSSADAIHQVSSLQTNKVNLENSHHEMHSKVKMYETDINTVRLEAGNKIQELSSKVSAFQEKEKLAAVEHEQTMRFLEDLKLKEESYKSNVADLEMKLKSSESTRQQLVEDISYMKAELERVTSLQEEVLMVRNSLDTMKYENSKLEESMKRINEECEEHKEEKASLLEKVSTRQKALLECEEAKRSKVALEEKILRLECDLTAREALSAQDAGLKNELSRLKRANSQFQRKVQQLEQERDDCLKKSLAHEEKLRERTGESVKEELLLELPNGRGQGSFSQDTVALKEDNIKILGHHPQVSVEGLLEKVQVLETQLADAAEANNMYKEQLKSFLSGSPSFQAKTDRKLKDEDEATKTTVNRSNSALEAELKDLRERYFHMSLRYAEVEAEKEDLIMKVRSLKTNSGKGWFTRG